MRLAHWAPSAGGDVAREPSAHLFLQVHALISFPSVQATQGVRGCVRTERNKGCPHLKKRPGPDGPSIPHVMSGPVQKSQYPSQERAVIGGAAPQKSLILTENGPFPQNFGACGELEAGAPRRRHTSPAAARPSETGVVQPPRSVRENLLVRGLVVPVAGPKKKNSDRTTLEN